MTICRSCETVCLEPFVISQSVGVVDYMNHFEKLRMHPGLMEGSNMIIGESVPMMTINGQLL